VTSSKAILLVAILSLPTLASAQVAPPVLGVLTTEIAGRPLQSYPWFSHELSYFAGTDAMGALDTQRYPTFVGTADVYLVAHKSYTQWQHDRVLVDVRGAPTTFTFAGNGTSDNRFLLPLTGLTGDAGPSLGVPYDVVIDFDRDARLSRGDVADGVMDRPGLYVLKATASPGPYAVTEILYSGGSFLGQDLYYPTNIASLGQLPLVVVSHGNGHDYQWYDHIGMHLASYGCIVMSHQNNTMPGVETASTTTLTNTEYLLSHLNTIASGALQGHLDVHRIAWIGHSRGAEGVARAYDRIFDGTYVPVNFAIGDIKLVSSIAPTDFLGPTSANPHGVPYSLWTGGADNDVNGCASNDIAQTFHLLERATGTRQSISLHGVGHGAFHNGTADLVATGPCLISRVDTHAIMKAYLLPMVKYYLEGNEAGKDSLWRQWETFHSPGTSESLCVNVDLQFRESPTSGKVVVDDFQTQTGAGLSSSGAAVVWNTPLFVEGVFNDNNLDFTALVTDPMNGITLAGPGDTSAGIVFEWTDERLVSFDVLSTFEDVSGFEYLSFRAAQLPRVATTTAALMDLGFAVRLADAYGVESTIEFRTYGGGLEEPYQRQGCGTGTGWAAEFETVRIRLDDFLRDGTPLDLKRIVRVDFLFGASHGSPEGRIGFDDLEFCPR